MERSVDDTRLSVFSVTLDLQGRGPQQILEPSDEVDEGPLNQHPMDLNDDEQETEEPEENDEKELSANFI